MNRWLRNHCWEIGILLLTMAVFYGYARLLRTLDSGMALATGNFLQTAIFGAMAFFFGVFCVWMALEVAFKAFSRFMDIGHFEDAFEELRPHSQICFVVITFLALFYFFIRCCELAK
ncbi:MAG: hypothetical protein V1746_06440 [bacterium]